MSYPLTYQSSITSLIEQSPITDKYYLQLADHTLLDLFKESIKNILIYNIPLQQLPITKLQKQFYIIYDNTAVKQQQILEAIKDEIRQAARLQKQFLDMSYSAIQKQKQVLADMREQDNVWSVSWRTNKSNSVGEPYKKSYGIAANLFCNSYHSFVLSIKDIIKLIDYLYKECLIPQINYEELEGSLLEMVIHQFFLHYKCLDLHKVLPIMTNDLKQSFVYCSEFGIDLRKKVCKYKEEDASEAVKEKLKSQRLKIVGKEVQQEVKKQSNIASQQRPKTKADLTLLSNQMTAKAIQLKKVNDKIAISTKNIQKITSQQLVPDKKLLQQKITVKSSSENQISTPIRTQPEAIQIKQVAKPTQKKQAFKITEPPNQPINNKITVPITQNNPISIPKQSSINTIIQTKQSTDNEILKIAKSISSKLDERQKIQIVQPQIGKKQKQTVIDPKKQINYSNKKKIVKNSPTKESKRKMIQTDNLNHLKVVGCKTQFQTIQKIGKTSGPQKITISKTNFMLNSQPCEARVTSLQFNTQDLDKKDLNHFRLTTNQFEEFIREQSFVNSKLQQEKVEQKEEIDQEEKQVEDENKKKKRKNKKKKNKKTQQTKNQHEVKSQKKQSTIQKPILEKLYSKKEIKTQLYPMTEQQKNINNYLQCLQIDQNSRIQCKIDESALIKWRNLRAAVLSSFK